MITPKTIRYILLTLIILVLLPTAVFGATVTVFPTSKISTECGSQEAITVNVVNNNNHYGTLCWWSTNNINWNKATNSCLSPRGGTFNFPINLRIPNQGSTTNTISVVCKDYGSSYGCGFLWLDTCYRNTCEANSPWSSLYAQQAVQKTVTLQCDPSKQQADSEKTTAQSILSNAQAAINSAQSKINEASRMGADVSSATQSINQAEADLQTANTFFSSGDSAYNGGNYNNARSYYQQAQTKASSAQSSAIQTKSQVDVIIEDFNRKKVEAQNKVSDSNSAIDTAKQRISAADKVISDATIIGLDTAQAKADIATARTKIDTAEDYYSEASNLFSANNFEGAKSKASSAINLADQAEELATNAYNVLQERLTVMGESSKSILEANSEISQMNEILTKMDYIVRSVEKWGVGLENTKSVVNGAKTNVDNAEDLLSQAKNRQDSGQFNQAINSANQARDSAATSRNRLDTMTHTLSLNIQNALEAAYKNLELGLAVALNEVKSAQDTYGATPELVISAQRDIVEANNKMEEAEKLIQNVKTASDLMPLLEKAESAFHSLEVAQQRIESSKANAYNAKLGLAKKVGAGAAVAIAVAGGGFLYYRRKKKKRRDPKSKKNLEEEIKEEEEQVKGEELEGISEKRIETKKHKNIIRLEQDIKKMIDEGKTKKEIIKELEEEGWSKKKLKKIYNEVNKDQEGRIRKLFRIAGIEFGSPAIKQVEEHQETKPKQKSPKHKHPADTGYKSYQRRSKKKK